MPAAESWTEKGQRARQEDRTQSKKWNARWRDGGSRLRQLSRAGLYLKAGRNGG